MHVQLQNAHRVAHSLSPTVIPEGDYSIRKTDECEDEEFDLETKVEEKEANGKTAMPSSKADAQDTRV